MTVNNRTMNGQKCPYCANKRVCDTNSLASLFPDISKEWHPTKNEEKTPTDFVSGSHAKVWWLCPNGHAYRAAIKSRTSRAKPTNCPNCTHQTSSPEMRIMAELRSIFDEVVSRKKIEGFEADIFIPQYQVAIEYDGSYFHKDTRDRDLKKNAFFHSEGILLIRVRHAPLKALSDDDIIVEGEDLTKGNLNEIFSRIAPLVSDDLREAISNYRSQDTFVDESLFKKFLSCSDRDLI